MKTITAIFGSNLVNRYKMIMPVPVLESSMNQAWDKPLPSSVGHDLHRALGWNNVIALHLQPNLARIVGAIRYAETSEEMAYVRHVLNEMVSRRLSELDPEEVAELKTRLGDFLSANAKRHAQGCTAYLDSGIAARACPAIFVRRDADGLIPMSALNCVGPGVFEQNGLLLFAHQFFRRSLSRYNTPNDPFLKRLCAIARNEALDVRIALDEDLVGLPGTLLNNIELQYWWGPHFSDVLNETQIGVTRHESSESDRFFNAVSATEFWWYVQDERRTFECEEIRSLDVPSMGKSTKEFGCRFVHSILDSGTSNSIHLDGAVRLYDEDLMLERVDKSIMHFGRRAQYTKLWRIDGVLGVTDWKALISDYYRDNHLVGEYFGGVEPGEEEMRPKVIKIDEGRSIHDFAPCTMSRGDGVRIAISYHKHSDSSSSRAIIPINRYDKGDGWIDYVETSTIEVVKLLKRRGEAMEFAQDTAIIAFEDKVSNLPMIEHCGDDANECAQITLEVIRDYCVGLSERGDDRMLGFHISVRFADRDAHFSYAGHVDDLSRWLQSSGASLPRDTNTIGRWADAATNWISEAFPDARDVPPLENMIKIDGLLTVDRKFLTPEEFEFHQFHPPVFSLVKCESIENAMPLIKKKSLVATTAFLIKKSECRKCHGSYRDCGCIKILDPDVIQDITEAEMYGVFWTDRSAWDVTEAEELPEGFK